MRARLLLAILAALIALGCGGSGVSRTGIPLGFPSDALYVANQGSSTISAFHIVNSSTLATAPVEGSPFHLPAPPTALGEVILAPSAQVDLVVLSAPQKEILLYKVDGSNSALDGPLCTISDPYTPEAVSPPGVQIPLGPTYFYVANAQGSVSAYQFATGADCPTEIAGSPFPAGAGASGIAYDTFAGLNLYVANALSNNVSGYSQDLSTGILSPLAGSPFPAGITPVAAQVVHPSASGPAFLIVANQGSNNLSVIATAGDGSLTPVPSSPFAAGTAPTAVTYKPGPVGHLYVANAQSNNISGYAVDASTGALTPVPGSPFAAGKSPSSLALSGEGNWLYVTNTGSNNLSVYSIDPGSGTLTPAPGSPFAVGTQPRAVLYFQVVNVIQ